MVSVLPPSPQPLFAFRRCQAAIAAVHGAIISVFMPGKKLLRWASSSSRALTSPKPNVYIFYVCHDFMYFFISLTFRLLHRRGKKTIYRFLAYHKAMSLALLILVFRY
jgi:hypothetical protein